MKIFGPLYERALKWAGHERAPTYLTVLSFIEAIIFPVMPEVMLAPMCVAQPKRGWWFATLSLSGSMVGALVGYALGHFAFEAVKPLLAAMGMLPGIESGIAVVQEKMAESPWAVFTFLVLGGFMPIPMKVFTWASGIVGAVSYTHLDVYKRQLHRGARPLPWRRCCWRCWYWCSASRCWVDSCVACFPATLPGDSPRRWQAYLAIPGQPEIITR